MYLKRARTLFLVVLLGLGMGVQAQSATLSGTIDFLVWGNASSDAIDQLVINEFEKTHPGIKVNLINSGGSHLDKLVTMIAGGSPPDIAIVDGYDYSTLAMNGQILDVTEWAKRDNVRGEFIQPAYWEEMIFEGRLYSVANVRSGYLAMPFNQTLFDEVGAPGPYDGAWTWDAMLDAAKRITRDVDGDGQNDRWGVDLATNWAFWPWVWMNGGELLNPEQTRVTLDSPEAVEAIKWLADIDLTYRVNGNYKELYNGRLAMRSNWATGDINQLRETAGFDWDIAPLPAGSVTQVTAAKGNEVVIPFNAENKELAWEFMKFLSSEQAQYIYGVQGRFFPSHRKAGVRLAQESLARNEDPKHLLILAEMNARSLPLIPGFRELQNMWRNEMRKVLRGEISAQEAGTLIAEQSVPILAEARKK